MLAVILAAALAAPNIVLISVDTLRPDHLGFYGHPFATSPHLDRLAANSLVFDDAICEVPLTGPSFGAMMTSRYPRATGVTRNGIRMPEGVPTVAEILSTAGYETMCVTSNWTLKAKLSGLDRGFDSYDDEFRKKRWVVLKDERDAGEVTDLAIARFAARDAARPFFGWFHYSDPHAPYRSQEGFQVSTEADYDGDPGAKEKVQYDSEIAYADAEIHRLIEALPKENTVIVFIGDHGESLHEHEYLGHGRRLYQTGLRIPFFIHAPGVAPGRNNAPVRGLDLAPTILGLAGVEAAPEMRGANLMRGLPHADRVRVVEAYGGAVLNLPGAKVWMTKAGPELQSVIRGGWKLIRQGGASELYYLPDDPQEAHNLAGKTPERLASLESSIAGWAALVVSGNAVDADLSAEDVEALESLGYVK